jgi:hypothetical protein
VRTYKILAVPNLHFAIPGRGLLLAENVLAEGLEGLVVRELGQDPNGRWTLHLQLERPSPEHALEEIASAIERLGFSVLEATVSEWASEALERALVGLLGGGLLGASSKKGVVAVAGAALGALVGGWSGAEARQLAGEYRARRDPRGVWSLERMPQQAPSPALRPGLASA